jgi:hypothetical protein
MTAANHLTPATLAVDPEFQALIPPLTPDERAQLETDLLAAGRAPLIERIEKTGARERSTRKGRSLAGLRSAELEKLE